MYAPKVNRLTGQGGYTIMEMLVVVLIIGILAAIAIPAYQDYILRAHDTATLSDIKRTAEAWTICRDKTCDFQLYNDPYDNELTAYCMGCKDPSDDGPQYVMSSEFTQISLFPTMSGKYNISGFNSKGSRTFCVYNPPGDLDTYKGLGVWCPNIDM